MKNKRKELLQHSLSTDLVLKIFPYLDELREDGSTNMYGAHLYVMNDFDMDKDKAIKFVQAWMYQYKPKGEEDE